MTDHASRSGLAARNTANYGDKDFALYLRWSFGKSIGYSQAMLDRPVAGIVDTGSAYNNCHRTVPELKRGVLGAGGLPMPFPTASLCEAVAVSDVHAPGGTGCRSDADRSAHGDRSSARQHDAGVMFQAIALSRKGNPSFNWFKRIPPVRVSRKFQVRFPCVRHCALLIWISSKSNTATTKRTGEGTSVYRRIAIIFFNVALLSGAIVLLNACNTTAGVGQDVSAAGHAVTNTADKVKSGM